MNHSDEAAEGADATNERIVSAFNDSSSTWMSRLTDRVSWRLAAQLIWGSVVMWWLLSGARIKWPTMVLIGMVTGFLFVRDPRPRTFVRTFRDWAGVFIFMLGWAISRAGVDALGMPIQEKIWIDIDRVLGFGELPNHRLQQLIDWDGPAQLWEVSLSAMYVSHFCIGFGVLITLYYRDRALWTRWWHRYVLVGMIGLVCFILVPSAPPWMASDNGTIAMVHEGLPRGWDAVQIEWIHNLFEFGRDHANPVAAMPSLHAAFPATLYLFFAPRVGRFMQFVLASYALYMGFVIVITGMHWLIDVFAGWLVAWVAHVLMEKYEARKAAKALAAEAEALADPVTALA